MYGGLSLLAALGLGALHSLEPGHGKGVMSAYIVTSKAKAFHAVLIGIIAAISHSISICLIAYLSTLSITNWTPDTLVHWIELGSSLIIIYIGMTRLISVYSQKTVTVKKWGVNAPTHHHHGHGHHHHFHLHTDTEPKTLSQFFWVGFLTGIIPCPSALVVILAAIGSHHLIIGIRLAIAFSIGSALTLATIGYLLSHTASKLQKLENDFFARMLTVFSSCIIILLGMLVLFTSIQHLLTM